MKHLEDYADLVESGPDPFDNDRRLRREMWQPKKGPHTLELSQAKSMFGGVGWCATVRPPYDDQYRSYQIIAARTGYGAIKRASARWLDRHGCKPA